MPKRRHHTLHGGSHEDLASPTLEYVSPTYKQDQNNPDHAGLSNPDHAGLSNSDHAGLSNSDHAGLSNQGELFYAKPYSKSNSDHVSIKSISEEEASSYTHDGSNDRQNESAQSKDEGTKEEAQGSLDVSSIKLSSTNYFELSPIEQKYVQLKVQQEILRTFYSKQAILERAKRNYELHYQIQKARGFFKVDNDQVVVAKPAKQNTENFQIWLSLCAEWVLDEIQKCKDQGVGYMTQAWANQRAHALNQILRVIKSSALLCGVEYNNSLRDLADYVRSVDSDLDEVITQNLEDDEPSAQADQPGASRPDPHEFCQAHHCNAGESVKHCYKQRARRIHPDKNKDPRATHDFQMLNAEYSTLENFKDGLEKLEKTTC